MTIKCMIVDDEPFARKLLEDYCGRLPDLEVKGCFASGIEAMAALQQTLPDLLFLDIQMPGLNGLDLLQTLPDKPHLIFTTAYSEYAVEGFELDAVDYLLKPFDFPRFLKAINKFKTRQQTQTAPALAEVSSPLFVKEGRELVRLEIENILFIKGQKDYVQFHMLDGQRTLSLMNLKDLEQQLADYRFLRIHQSYIINTAHLKRCALESVQVGKQTLPVSQSYRLQLKAYLKDLQ